MHQSQHIKLDNLYMSVRISEFILNHETLVTRTIRQNRGIPKELTDTSLQKYQSECIRHFLKSWELLLVKFVKCVCERSTKYNTGFVKKSKYLPFGYQTHFKKPDHIDYNYLIESNDVCDQDLEPLGSCWNTRAWFMKIGLHLIPRMLLNAKVVYMNTSSSISFLGFTLKFCAGLLEKNSIQYASLTVYKEDLIKYRNTSTLFSSNSDNTEQNTSTKEMHSMLRKWNKKNFKKDVPWMHWKFCIF